MQVIPMCKALSRSKQHEPHFLQFDDSDLGTFTVGTGSWSAANPALGTIANASLPCHFKVWYGRMRENLMISRHAEP